MKLAVLHLDESTPHLHIMVSTETKSVKNYKNRYGVSKKETWSLNAERYNPNFLRGLHDRHAAHNKKFGLKRGVKGSMRKHTDLKEFYDIVDKALDTDYQKQIESTIETLETGLISKKVSIDEVRKKFAPMLNTLLKQNKALKAKFALDIKQWATELHDEAEALKKEREEVDRMKNHYGKGLRTISDLQAKNHLQQQLIAAKDREIEELKAQLPAPKGPANSYQYKQKA
jgi:chromosome segregation ATPase